MNRSVKLGDKHIGDGHPCFIVVELGVCHEQNVNLAEHFIQTAAMAGADSVKVESFQAEELVMDRSITHTYGTSEGVVTENYYELLKRLELGLEDHARLKAKADECGLIFFPTVANKRSIEFFEGLNTSSYKLASPDIVNYPLQRSVAETGKPIFLDTGGSFLFEIEKAVINLQAAGAKDVVIMHNPSGYPAPPEKTDLRMITTLKQVFDLPVGLSCHTPGFDMVMAALALGANVVEKPISRDRTIRSPEFVFSFLDSQAESFVRRIRDVEAGLGHGRRLEVNEDSLPRFIGRRGIYAARDLSPGENISEDNTILAKPEHGISVVFIDEIMGRILKRPVGKNQPITWEDV